MDGPYVLQQRIRLAAEPFPDGSGGVQDIFPIWGMYLSNQATTSDDGYAGGFIRGTDDPAEAIVGMASEAKAAWVFQGT
ncbi:MAG TPA: hypothetical protein VK453_13140 [Micromonosporaceae bacterium]|nr:hypothetical protein [Micromonosporaceae bacterium]